MKPELKHPDTTLLAFDVGNMIMRSAHRITFGCLDDLRVAPDKATAFFAHKAYSDFARGKITGVQYARIMREALEAPHLTDRQIRDAHNAHIWSLDEELVRLIERIKERGRNEIVFVTTTNEWQTERERGLIDLEKFGPVARSHEMGFTKTDEGAWPKIFEYFGLSANDAQRTLFIDDSIGNIRAAEQAGLMTHHFDLDPRVGVKKLCADLVITRRPLG